MAACGSNSSSDDNNSSTIFASAIPGRSNNSAAAAGAAIAAAGAAAGTRSFPTLVDDDSAVGDLRSSCDRCWSKKRKCTGEKPCSRCERGDVQCKYSTKRKLGRPRMSIMPGAAAAAESGKEGTEGSDEASPSTTKRTKQHATPGSSPINCTTTTAAVNSSNKSGSRSGSSSSCSSSSNSSGRRSSSGDSSGDKGRPASSSGSLMMSTDRPAISVSPATGLAGLAESRFLSCFLEHFAPMYEIANEACIRGGLVHAFVGRWAEGGMSPMQRPEVMRGNAFECILLSSMAIGGLMMGCPQSMVARHIDGARQCLAKFRGLSEQCAMTAMMLYGLSHAFQPPVDSNVEYRANMDEAQAIFNTFPEKDPLVAAFLTYRATCDNLIDFVESAYSVNPANISGRGRDANVDRSAGLMLKTVKGTAVAERAEPGPAGRATARRTPPPPAHPAYVVADALVLVYRFVVASGDTDAGWWHVHDFIAAEMTRLDPIKPGALVMITLGGSLIAAKAEVFTTDGMLALAELVLSMFQTCPGLLRYYALHNAHLSLAVFRLLGRRKAYDDLRDLAARADVHVPTFDEMIPGVVLCDSELCWKCVHSILKLDVRDDDQGPVMVPGFSARRTLSSRVPFLELGLTPRSHPSSQSDDCESPAENFARASSGGTQAPRAREEAHASPRREETAALLASEATSDACGGGSPWAAASAAAVVVGGTRGGVATSQGARQQPPSGGVRGRGAINQSGGVLGAFMLPKGELGKRHISAMPEQRDIKRQVPVKLEEKGYHVEKEGWPQDRGYGEEDAAHFAALAVEPRPASEDQAERAPDSMHCVGLSSRLEAEARQWGSEWIETGSAESRGMSTHEAFEPALRFDAGGVLGSFPSRVRGYRMPQEGWEGDFLEGKGAGGGGGGGKGSRGAVPSPDVAYALDSGGVPSFQAARIAARGGNFGSNVALVKTADDGSLGGMLSAAANEDVGIAPNVSSFGPRSGDAGYGSSGSRSGGSRPGVPYSGARAFGVAGTVFGASPVGRQVVLPGASHAWIDEQVDERNWTQATGKGRHAGFSEPGVCSELVGILLGDDGGGGAMS